VNWCIQYDCRIVPETSKRFTPGEEQIWATVYPERAMDIQVCKEMTYQDFGRSMPEAGLRAVLRMIEGEMQHG
jgi:hypothetical protein